MKQCGQRMYDSTISRKDKTSEEKKSIMADMRRLATLYLEFVGQSANVHSDSRDMLSRKHVHALSEAIQVTTTNRDSVEAGLKIAI